MAHDEFRLLAAAVVLERFTAVELTAAAQTNPNTTRSWLARNRTLLKEVQSALTPDSHSELRRQFGTPSRGRPPVQLAVTSEGLSQMRRQLDELHRATGKAAAGTEQRRLLDTVESSFRRWTTLRDRNQEEAAAHLTALRVALRLAWQELTRLDAHGESVASSHLHQLAEIEHAAGLVVPPATTDLQQIALWLGGRLDRLILQEASESFATRVMWIRSEARGTAESRKVTVAALAACVWADEGLATSEVGIDALTRCRAVAEQVPVHIRLEAVSWAIRDDGAGVYYDDGQVQAMVRGITACTDARLAPVRDWLVAAPVRGDWRPALAPMIIHGLLNVDDLNLTPILRNLHGALEAAFSLYDGVIGRLRGEAFDYGKRALSDVQIVPDRNQQTDDLMSRLARRFGSSALPERSADPVTAL